MKSNLITMRKKQVFANIIECDFFDFILCGLKVWKRNEAMWVGEKWGKKTQRIPQMFSNKKNLWKWKKYNNVFHQNLIKTYFSLNENSSPIPTNLHSTPFHLPMFIKMQIFVEFILFDMYVKYWKKFLLYFPFKRSRHISINLKIFQVETENKKEKKNFICIHTKAWKIFVNEIKFSFGIFFCLQSQKFLLNFHVESLRLLICEEWRREIEKCNQPNVIFFSHSSRHICEEFHWIFCGEKKLCCFEEWTIKKQI